MNPEYNTPKEKNNSRLVLILSSVAAALLLGIGSAFAIHYFTNDDSSSSEQVEEDTVSEDILNNVPKSEIDIDKSIVDEELGFDIRATKIVINPFDLPEQHAAENRGKTIVLIETTISTEGRYENSPSAASLTLLDDSGNAVVATDIIDAEMEEAGYIPSPFSGSREGVFVAGYAAYLVDTDQIGIFTLRYDRPATESTEPGGGTVPAETFEVKLND